MVVEERAGSEPVRVIQWATGSLGKIAIKAFVERPEFELVGVHVYSPPKVGRDAGEIAGIEPINLPATGSIDEVLALDADCVFYAPLTTDIADICRIVESGKNIVTASAWLAPDFHDRDEIARIESACAKGGASLYCAGVHPGYIGEATVWNLARMSHRIDRIEVHEFGDLSHYPSRPLMDYLGFGVLPDDTRAADAPEFYRESIALLAAGLGICVDNVVASTDVAITTQDVTIPAGTLPKGTVAAKRWTWSGLVDGVERIQYTTTYHVTDKLDRSLSVGRDKYTIIISGEPSLHATINAAEGEPGAVGRVWGAMTPINAIREVCAAPPGILTHLDLPLHPPPGLAAHWRES